MYESMMTPGMAWTDEQGIDHAVCACGHDCSTHEDAAYSLGSCGDCGAATCEDCRVCDAAGRCSACAAVFYLDEWRGALFDARDQAGFRIDDGETIEEAAEAVYPYFGGEAFREQLVAVLRGASVLDLVKGGTR